MHFVAWRDPANDDTGEGFGILHKMDKTNKQQTEKKNYSLTFGVENFLTRNLKYTTRKDI